MASCCENKSCALDALRERQGSVLRTVLWINAIMFVVELTAGILASSVALMSDSLDMLGDASVYAFSLYALSRSSRWRAGAALFKGLIMLGFGLGVLATVIFKIMHPVIPEAETMGWIGALALAANTWCLLLLTRHRQDDINMKSVWLCSRNDIISNVGVLLSGAAVAWMQSMWPDILVGLAIATLFLWSAFHVIVSAVRELRHAPVQPG